MQHVYSVAVIISMVLFAGAASLWILAETRIRNLRENVMREKLRVKCVIAETRAVAREELLGEQMAEYVHERERVEMAFFTEFRIAIPPKGTIAFAMLQTRIDEKVAGINDHDEFDRVAKIVTDAGFFALTRKNDYFNFDRVLMKK